MTKEVRPDLATFEIDTYSGITTEVTSCGVSPLRDIGARQKSRRKSEEH
jgi:hypothetical protein